MASTRVVLAVLFAFCPTFCVTRQSVHFPTTRPTGTKNDRCSTSTGPPTTCIEASACPTPVRSPSGSFLEFCGFAPFRVCCPETAPLISNNTSARRRRRATSIPAKPNTSEEIFAIAGGIESFAHSWPWMVLLGRRRGPSRVFFCGGALINNRYVLTAGHCVLNPRGFFVRLGEHGIFGAEKASFHEDIAMEDVIFHPEYKSELGYHDIALVKLSRPVNFRNEIKPICLPWGPTGAEDLVGEIVTLTGWGAEGFGGPLASILREVNVTVFDPSRCQKSYATLPDFVKSFPKGMSKDNIVCAGDRLGVKDSCQGDSGGPMVHKGQHGVFSLAGIISKGYGCGKPEFPGLYAPLRHYKTLNWIKTTAF